VPDGPARWTYGYHCNAGHDARGSKVFSAPDFRRYAAALGPQAQPRAGANVLLGVEEGDVHGGVGDMLWPVFHAPALIPVWLGFRIHKS